MDAGSPITAARRWLQLAVEGDIEAVWPLTSSTLRLAMVQDIIWKTATTQD